MELAVPIAKMQEIVTEALKDMEPEELGLQPTATWFEDKLTGMICCSNCKTERNPHHRLNFGKWNYCPNCGAKMEGWTSNV